MRLLVRLCNAVKDLDFASTLNEKEIPLATSLFRKGVTNMAHFLSAAKSMKNGDGKTLAPQAFLFNEREKDIWSDFTASVAQVEELKERFRENMSILRRAKELNYEVIADLLRLIDQVHAIYNVASGKERRAEEFVRVREYQPLQLYENVLYKLKEMRRCVNRVTGTLSTDEEIDALAHRFSEPISLMDAVAKDATVSHLDRVYEEAKKIADDKRGHLESWDDVDTLEEAVRFLHNELYVGSNLRFPGARYEIGFTNLKFHDFFIEQLSVFDLTSSGVENSRPGRIFLETLRTVSISVKDEVYTALYNLQPFVVVGDDYIDMSFPSGKHRIDVSAGTKEGENEEYEVTVDYFESGYEGALERFRYVAAVLEDLGFRFQDKKEEDFSFLRANFFTRTKEDWEKAFAQTVRLMHSTTNVDLMHGSHRVYVHLFKKGITDIYRCGYHFLQLERGSVALSEKAKNFASIFAFGGYGEQEAAAKLLLQKGRTTKEIQAIIAQLNDEQKKDLLNVIDEWITQAYQIDDANEAKRLEKKHMLISKSYADTRVKA